ncbi:MAG TPA: YdcF family protein [Bryobacteraceae bacterium]|nr:YdcF family protein [Bryobacteraceae bacterium]
MKTRWTAVLAVATVLAFAGWLAHDRILGALGRYLVDAAPAEKADIAVVLAGDAYGHRILTAADLVRNGYAPLVLVSGPGGEYDFHECDLAIPFAVKRGYPESYFAHFEHDGRSTAEEAQAIVPELRRRNVHKALLVTSNFHTRRAGGIFRRAAPDMTIVTIGAPDEYFTPGGWWHSREGEKTFLVEWEKTVASWVGL